MGAWIEIDIFSPKFKRYSVAPHMGAWIEIKCTPLKLVMVSVAPHMGAWIEIQMQLYHPNL